LIQNALLENCSILSVLRGYGGKGDKLHYLIPYLAKLIEDQVTKNMRYHRFEPGISPREKKQNRKFLAFREKFTGYLIDDR